MPTKSTLDRTLLRIHTVLRADTNLPDTQLIGGGTPSFWYRGAQPAVVISPVNCGQKSRKRSAGIPVFARHTRRGTLMPARLSGRERLASGDRRTPFSSAAPLKSWVR